MELQPTSWDALRKQARKLQDQLDDHMNSYRRLVAMKGDASGDDLESAIDRLLKQLQQVNSQMQSLMSSGGSEFFSHTLTRHQEILQDFTQEFYRLRSSLRAKQEHASLLQDFRDFDRARFDLEENGGSEEQTLLREQAAISRNSGHVSLSAFAFLFSEMVQYNRTQVDNIAELERRLEDAGYAVGARVLELLCHREKGNRRETRLLGILSFVRSTVWKVLFGKVADSLEKGTEHEDEYMISERELLVNRFISVPKDMGAINCGAFVAGIVRGVLDSAGFPAVVTAHFVPMEGQQRPRTNILIKFAEEARKLQDQLDDHMNSYRRLVAMKGDASGDDLESAIDRLLKQLQQVNSQMQSLMSSGGSEFFSHTLTRHQEILQDFTQEFYRLRSSLRAKQEHASLLQDFRDFDRARFDLEENGGSEEQTLLREQAAISRNSGHVWLSSLLNCLSKRNPVYGARMSIKFVMTAH